MRPNSDDPKADSSRRRSERLGMPTPPNASPVRRKSPRLEEKGTPGPVGRACRFQTPGSAKNASSSHTPKNKGQEEKYKSAEASRGDTDNSTKREFPNARSYKAIFKKKKKPKGGEGIEPPLEPEFTNPDQSLSDNPPVISARPGVDGILMGCTNTKTVVDVSGSPKDHSRKRKLQISTMSRSSTSMQKGGERIEPPLEPEFTNPDQSLSDNLPVISVRPGVDDILIDCTNTKTVVDVSGSPKNHSRKRKLQISTMSRSSTSMQRGDTSLERGLQVTQLESESPALPLEVDSSRILANKDSYTVVDAGYNGPTSRSRKRAKCDGNGETSTKYQKVVDTRDTASNLHMESEGQKAVSKADSDQPKSENDKTRLLKFLKDEMEKLCLVLQLSIDIKKIVGAFWEYLIENHPVSKEPVSTRHAFQISLCWTAAKLFKQKMSKRETLARAKSALDFQCTAEEAHSTYLRLKALKKTFWQLQRKDSVLLPSQAESAPQPLTMLEEQQEREVLDFHKTKEQKKCKLENDYKIEAAFVRIAYHEGTSRSMLRNLENELKKNIQEHENLAELQFKELQARHSAEKKKMVDEWRTKEMSCIASTNAEKEVPSASHSTEKQSLENVVWDNETQNLITSGLSVTVADNAVPSEASLRTERVDAEPAVIEPPEITSQRSPQIQTTFALEAGGSGVSSDTSLCFPVNSVQGELLEIEPGCSEPLTLKDRSVETNQISHPIPEDEIPVSATVVNPEVFSQTPPDKLEIEHARVEPVKGVERSKESSSQNNSPSAVPCTGGSEVDDTPASEIKNSFEVKTGQGGGNTVESHNKSNHNNEPSSVRRPSGSNSGNACFSETETRNTMCSVGDHNIPSPQPSTEDIIASPNLLEKNVHEKNTGNLASDCTTLSVDAVDHVHIESTNSLSAPAASVQMVESSMELPHQAVSQNEGTLELTSVEEMYTGNHCSQFEGSIVKPGSVTSQGVEKAVEHSHEETMVQPPSREVNPVHRVSATSQVVDEPMEHPHEETRVQPPSTKFVDRTHHVSETSEVVKESVEHSHEQTMVQPPSREVDPTIRASATSQVVEEFMEHPHEETMAQPPSREVVGHTHRASATSQVIDESMEQPHEETMAQPPSGEVVGCAHRAFATSEVIEESMEQPHEETTVQLLSREVDPTHRASVTSQVVEESMEQPHEETMAQPPSGEIVGCAHRASATSEVVDESMEHSHEETTVQPPSREVIPTHGASATSQMAEESVEYSHQVTMVQPPSRDIVDTTRRVNHCDLETVAGTYGAPSVEPPSAFQNILAPSQFLAQPEPNQAATHVNPMHYIDLSSALAAQTRSVQYELYTLSKEREQILKHFDSQKSFLMAECARKQEETRKKYEKKLKEAESAFIPEITQIESNFRVAYMHRNLSEALQFKCLSSGDSTAMQGSVCPPFNLQMQHQVQQGRLRHPSAPTLSSTSHPTSVQQNGYPPVWVSRGHPALNLYDESCPLIQPRHQSSARSSITPVGSSRVGPHFQPQRPTAPLNLSNMLIPGPSLQYLSSPSVPAYQVLFRPMPPSLSPSTLHQSTSWYQGGASSQLSRFNAQRNFAGSSSGANAPFLVLSDDES